MDVTKGEEAVARSFIFQLDGTDDLGNLESLTLFFMRRRMGRDLQEDIDIGLSRNTDCGQTWPLGCMS